MSLVPKINIPRDFSQLRVGLTPRHADESNTDMEQDAASEIPASVLERLSRTVSDAKNKGVKLS